MSRIQDPTIVPYFQQRNIKVKDVVCGKRHTIALDEEGRVFSWGKGKLWKYKIFQYFYPQAQALGHEESRNFFVPKPIKALKDIPIEQISTGNDFAMGLSEENQLWVWGRGEFGVLGFTNKQQRLPVLNTLVEELKNQTLKSKIKKISSCSDFSSILFENGKIFSFGNNDQGNLGLGTTQSVDTCDVIQTPTEVSFDEKPIKFLDFSLGECSTAYLSQDNRVYFTGRKLVFKPKLFELDYDQHKVKKFCATDKGIAVLTEENKVFYNGNFWAGSTASHDVQTGIKEINMEELFGGHSISELGGEYSTKYVLVEPK